MNPKKTRTIWGTNIFTLLGVGTVALGIISLIGYAIYKQITRKRYVSSVVNVDPSASIQSQWSLGEFEPIGKTKYFMASVSSNQSYEMSYYEKGASAVRNYMFVDTTDKSARWLVPTNNYLFLNAQQLQENDHSPGELPFDKMRGAKNSPDKSIAKWMLYIVVNADTNSDQRLTEKDRRVMAISSVSGDGYTELIQNVDAVKGSTLPDENTLIFFYESDKKYFVAEINLAQHQVTETKELPKFPLN